MKMRDFVQFEAAVVPAVIEGANKDAARSKAFRQRRAPAATAYSTVLLVILALLTGCDSNSATAPQAKARA